MNINPFLSCLRNTVRAGLLPNKFNKHKYVELNGDIFHPELAIDSSTLLSSALIFGTNPVTMLLKTSLQESMKYEVFSIVGASLSKPEKSHDERISAGYPQNTDYFNTQYSIR